MRDDLGIEQHRTEGGVVTGQHRNSASSTGHRPTQSKQLQSPFGAARYSGSIQEPADTASSGGRWTVCGGRWTVDGGRWTLLTVKRQRRDGGGRREDGGATNAGDMRNGGETEDQKENTTYRYSIGSI